MAISTPVQHRSKDFPGRGHAVAEASVAFVSVSTFGQSKPRLFSAMLCSFGGAVQSRDDVLANPRAMLETSPGAATNEPDIVERGMAVDEEGLIRCRLVLADATFHDGPGN